MMTCEPELGGDRFYVLILSTISIPTVFSHLKPALGHNPHHSLSIKILNIIWNAKCNTSPNTLITTINTCATSIYLLKLLNIDLLFA